MIKARAPLTFLVVASSVLGAQGLCAQDTLVVRADGPGLWQSVRLVEELRIGVLDGDDRYIFGSVSGVQPTEDGSVWVVDSQGPRVRIYDNRGSYVRDVAGAGAGPGEYARVAGIDATPEGNVAIWDLSNARISLYRPDGEYYGLVHAESGWYGYDAFQIDRQGRFWIYVALQDPACVRTYTLPDGTVQRIGSEAPGCIAPAYQRFTVDAELEEVSADTVLVPLPIETERVKSFVISTAEGPYRPFIEESGYSVSPMGYVVTWRSRPYAIDFRADGSSGVTRVTRSYDPVRMGREERAEWQGRADYYTRTLPPSALSSGVPIPDVKPAVRETFVDHDGRIWVHRYVAAERRAEVPPSAPDRPPSLTWREPPTYDVFDADGRFLGTVVLPRNTSVLWSSSDVVWGVTRGQFDESYVVRYRLTTR